MFSQLFSRSTAIFRKAFRIPSYRSLLCHSQFLSLPSVPIASVSLSHFEGSVHLSRFNCTALDLPTRTVRGALTTSHKQTCTKTSGPE